MTHNSSRRLVLLTCRPAPCPSRPPGSATRLFLGPTFLRILWISFFFTFASLRTCSANVFDSLHFTSSFYNASVPENAFGNTAVVSDGKMGIFLPDNSFNIKYRITDGDPDNFFKTSSRVVGDFCFLEIIVRTGNQKVLNRESRDSWTLVIKALQRMQDKSKEEIPGAVVKVYVTITDLNDLSPLFLDTKYEVRISEDTPLYTSIARVKAEDPDYGLNGEIYYSFQEQTSVFAIHPTSGVVSLTRPLSQPEQSRYDLTIIARDRGLKQQGSYPARASLTVNVTVDNVWEPTIEVTRLTEFRPSGHLIVVAIVNIRDNDRGPSGEVKSLEIDGDSDKVFRILLGSVPNEFYLAALNTLKWEDAPYGFNLSLKATDNGARPKFSSWTPVRILPPPTPLEEPVFTQTQYDMSISESSPPGSKVIGIATWLPGTQTRISFTIVAGNENNQFRLDSKSGVLWTSKPLDADTHHTFTLIVTATTSGLFKPNQQSSAKVIIRVQDANDYTPIIVAPQGSVTVKEHQPPQVPVTTVRAQDYDFDENKRVSYSIANTEDVPFLIDHFTGRIKTSRTLDYETEKRIWKLKVRVSDWGIPYRRQSEKTITVRVIDVNDNRPQFERTDCTGYIDATTPFGYRLMTLSAIDFDEGNIVGYRIASGNEDRCFNLDSTLGSLILSCDVQDIKGTERILNFTATDGEHFSDTMTTRLQILQQRSTSGPPAAVECKERGIAKQLEEQLALAEKNNPAKEDINLNLLPKRRPPNEHSPEMPTSPIVERVRENSPVGTTVFHVNAKDGDSGYDGYLVYALSDGNDESVFDIDKESGDILVAGSLDRERTSRYSLNVTVYDLGKPQRSASQVVVVILVDENDNSPRFDKAAESFFLPENVANGTSIYQLVAHDPDEGINGVITYKLETDTKDFYLDAVTGRLSVVQPLDIETQEVYELRVMATDGGGRSSIAYITIQLVDINDCAPEFPKEVSSGKKIPEDLPLGALVSLVAAHDPDSENIIYTLENDHNHVFHLDQDTAALRLAKPLDFERVAGYNISIRATDDGNPSLSSVAHIYIQVIDVNENVHAPVFGHDVLEASISEASPPNTLVASAPAKDGDLNLNPSDSDITYSLSGGDITGLFYIDHRGDIYTSTWLDRETKESYWLTVVAQDSGTIPRHSTLHVYVKILDENDNRPLSTWPVYWPDVMENASPNTLVASISATDPDDPDHTQLRYSIIAGNPQSLFSIDEFSGEIRTTERHLDRELQPEHFLEVLITDGDDAISSLSSTSYVIVSVMDENDNSPEFLEQTYRFSVPLHSSSALIRDSAQDDHLQKEISIGQVTSVDLDSGENSDITYSIKENKWSHLFRIEPKTGRVYAKPTLNPNKNYQINVEAEDSGRPPLSSSCLVSIKGVAIPFESSNAPRILMGEHVHTTIMETDPQGSLVKLVEAEDADGDKLWFDIQDGNSDELFGISKDEGNIYVALPLDAEQVSSSNLTISVTDGIYTTTSLVSVTIIDVNDNRPSFSQPTYELEVGENTSPGTTIFTLTASDADSDKHLTFSLVNTAHIDTEEKFKISPISGDIVLERPLDRETQDMHILTVSVSDRINPIKKNFARVKITVRDYNDHKPEFLLPIYKSSVLETAAVGSRVQQVVAIDRDKGPNGHVTYSIIAGNTEGTFRLDPEQGIISISRSLSVRERPEYWLSIKASDDGSPSKESHVNVNIQVQISPQAPPRFHQEDYLFEVSENARVGTYLGALTMDSYLGAVFSLMPNEQAIPFTINPATGVISIDGPLDYEAVRSYNVTLIATSMNGKESSAKLTINILDENDNAPFFVESSYVGHISEAASVNSVVLKEDNKPLVILAQDDDSERNANLFYEIIDEEAKLHFSIDSSTGAIRTTAPLDHEVTPLVNFSVSVHDSGKPRLSSFTSALVTVVIGDINDVPPRFLQQDYNVTLFVPTHRDVYLIQLTATDLDFEGQSPLQYGIVAGNEEGKFKIDPQTGIISINDSSAFNQFYRLKATVSDGQFASSTAVNVFVESMPKTGLRFARDKYFASVKENTSKVDNIVMVHVLGSELNEHLKFKILNPSNLFEIGDTSGVIKTTGVPFDREEKDNFTIVVEVRSSSSTSPSRVAHVPVIVSVLDKNDNAPIFVNTPYYGIIPVDSLKGTTVFKIHATDFDKDENRRVRYELIKGNGELFSVRKATGEIVLKQTLEGHSSQYELIINAYDGGSPSLSSQVTVRLRVVDRSEPIFEKQFYSASVAENADQGTPIITMEARSQLGRKLMYAIVDGNDFQTFSMDYYDGVVRVQDSLDYELQTSYQLTVRAVDINTGKSTEVILSVQILDDNDNPPEFSQYFYNISISEAVAFATPVLQVTSTDRDSGDNAGVSYQLKGLNGSLPQNFFLNESSGMLSLKKALDKEENSIHHFLVVATDTGTPPLSSTAHVYVRVLDMNDNPPKFEQQSYHCSVSEGALFGSFVTHITAYDEDETDKNKLIYTIVTGNDQQVFEINSNTGILQIRNQQRLKENPNYILNISVTDGVFTEYTRLTIVVTPVNENSPVFVSTRFEARVLENSILQTSIAKVIAIDEDSGKYGHVTYHFIGDEANKYFRIDENAGDIWTVKSLDRETRAEYLYTVMAMDIGGRSGFSTLHVIVEDENDNKPSFFQSNYKALIYKNSTKGYSVLKLQASDPDNGASGKLTYGFHQSTPVLTRSYFHLDEESGDLTLKVDSSHIENDLYEFFVEVKDGGDPPLHSNAAIQIRIVDEMTSPPEFMSKKYTFSISENQPPGSVIGIVSARYNGLFEYSIDWNQDSSPPLAIKPSGELVLRSRLNYEEISSFELLVSVYPSQVPELLATAQILIEVQDVNDEVPIYESKNYYISVAENTPTGSNILKVAAYDADSGSNSKISYRLEEEKPLQETPIFILDPYSGWITLNSFLDADTKSKYELTVIATDSGKPPLSSQATVVVEVIDYNDNPPVFSKKKYHSQVKEDAQLGTVVMELNVNDIDLQSSLADEETERGLHFYITSGNEMQRFHVRGGGQIYVVRPLDRESQSRYSLQVSATDGVFTATTIVYVQVLDVNDNPPICAQPYYNHLISEDAPPGTLLLRISATDPDTVSHPRYYLSGEGSESFSIEPGNGQLAILKSLDREKKSSYKLKATIRDGGHKEWECVCFVRIDISDVNDNPPMFAHKTYSINIPENSPENYVLMKAQAIDPDAGSNRKVSYSLESTNPIFEIDHHTGFLSATQSLDREKQPMYNLTIRAYDHGPVRLSSTTNILVLVTDMNDNPPEFGSQIYYTTVSESTSVGSDIARVLATSRDTGKNADITYSIIGGNEHRKFNIHPKTGVVSTIDELDYERGSNYLLTIQAKDGGDPPLSNHATVNVTITDINDNAPIFIQNSYSAMVNEAAAIGEKLIKVAASDQDSGKNGKLTYAISQGDPKLQFHVDKYNGWLSISRPLDREDIPSYALEIIALDEGIPQKSGIVSVHVEVTDANDNPPIFVVSNNTAYVQEDKSINHLVHRFEVTDNDSDRARNGAPFTFEIISGNRGNSFRITQDGELRTASRFDHKRKDLYRLQLRVYDNGRPPQYSETWFNVRIIEESKFAPRTLPLHVTAYIQPTSYSGSILGRVQASDEDPYDTLSYSIVPDFSLLDFKYFEIDERDGTISAKSTMDGGSYTLNVSVSDGKFSTHEKVDINFVEIQDQMIDNSVIVRLKGATPEEFLISYKNSFHRGLKNIFNVKSRDIIILSLQDPKSRSKRAKSRYKSYKEGVIDVLFAVRKTSGVYFPRNFIRKRVISERKLLATTLGLSVIDVPEDKCNSFSCANGRCKEVIILEGNEIQAATDAVTFVSPKHKHEAICICPPGYSGKLCDTVINKCASQPCPSYKFCVPQHTDIGYMCVCPEGLIGPTCNMNKSDCIGQESTPECYSPLKPLSLKGRGYAQYLLRVPIERHFTFSIWFRTRHPAGNILFAAGRLDYSILEIDGGQVRFRWDLGSGEGLVSTSIRVDDGLWHHISLERIGSTAFLSIDGTYRAEGSSPGSSEMLNLEAQHIFVGAEVRSWTGEEKDPRSGFVGCLDDARIENTPLPLDRAPTNRVASLIFRLHVSSHCYDQLSPPGICGSHPCLNGGTCQEKEDSFFCQCRPRFKGTHCEFDSDPCASSPCLNNGHCINDINSYRCECPSMVSGIRCQYMYCNPNPCLNGGVCEEGISGPICKCKGYTGTYCNIDVNECEKSPCQGGGKCINTYGSFRCMCPSNLTGSFCDVPAAASIFPLSLNEMVYIVVGVSAALILMVVITLTVLCRQRRRRMRRRHLVEHNHVVLNSKANDNHHPPHHNSYKRNSKVTNIQVSQSCTTRPDNFSLNPNEPVYVPLNNFDTIRSYGSAGDELENLPQYSREFVQNITKPNLHSSQNRNPSTLSNSSLGGISRSGSGVLLGGQACVSPYAASEAESHKSYRDALAINFKDAYYEAGKIQNDVKFNQGEYFNLKPLGGKTEKNTNVARDDSSVRSGASMEDMQEYHWDCSDWARHSQNPLPNILEVPGGEVRDSSSFHSNESNESIVIKPTNNQHFMPPCEGPINPLRDMETLPADELTSECGTDFDLDSRLDFNVSFIDPSADPGADSDTSLFVPLQPQRYETHPNQYLPKYHSNSEAETDDERGRLISNPPRYRMASPRHKYSPPGKVNPLPLLQNGLSSPPLGEHQGVVGSGGTSARGFPSSPPLGLRARNNRRVSSTIKRVSDAGLSITSTPDDDYGEGISLFGGPSNTSASDLENVCEIEDSEVNSEFENDK